MTGPRRRAVAPYAAFAAFGAFWGTWGAALPTLQSRTGVDEGQLGTALLFVGAGALPAMLVTGRLVDRLGTRVAAVLTAALAAAGVLVAVGARDLPTLVAGMLVVGATSGASDVAINTLAGQAEHRTGRPLLTRAHGVFSLLVVASSLGGGLLLARGDDTAPPLAVFGAAGAVMLALAAVVWAGADRGAPPPGSAVAPAQERSGRAPLPRGAVLTCAALGLVGAMAYAIENAHQSWGAVFVTDAFDAPADLAALAPATFAAAAAAARLTLAPLSRTHPTPLLIGGGALAALGSVVLATSSSLPQALLGTAIAATGTATLFPTLLSRGLRDTAPEQRGRATSAISTTAYLRFLLGPAGVGLLAATTGLRGAVLGIAVLAAAFAVLAAPVSRWADARTPSALAIGKVRRGVVPPGRVAPGGAAHPAPAALSPRSPRTR